MQVKVMLLLGSNQIYLWTKIYGNSMNISFALNTYVTYDQYSISVNFLKIRSRSSLVKSSSRLMTQLIIVLHDQWCCQSTRQGQLLPVPATITISISGNVCSVFHLSRPSYTFNFHWSTVHTSSISRRITQGWCPAFVTVTVSFTVTHTMICTSTGTCWKIQIADWHALPVYTHLQCSLFEK